MNRSHPKTSLAWNPAFHSAPTSLAMVKGCHAALKSESTTAFARWRLATCDNRAVSSTCRTARGTSLRLNENDLEEITTLQARPCASMVFANGHEVDNAASLRSGRTTEVYDGPPRAMVTTIT